MDINAKIKEVRVAVRLLDLPDVFDEKTLRKAYKEFARNWHPDKAMRDGLDAENANKMMAEGNKAYRLLKQRVAENGGTYRVPNEPPTGGATSVGQDTGYSGSASSYGSTTSWEDETGPGNGYWKSYAEQSEPEWGNPREETYSRTYSHGRQVQSDQGSEQATQKTSVIGDMFRSIRQPLGHITFWEASFFGKIFRLLVHGFGLAALFLFLYAFADLTLPLDNLTSEGMEMALFQDVLLSPMLIFILGLALFGIWAYRGIARFLMDFADASESIALVLDVLLVVGIAFASRPFGPAFRQAVNYVSSLMA